MRFDVVVVGGGHAGCEAASAAARLGRATALITLRAEAIGRLSCNPAVGGQGKGHLVREIDALGGLMARVADRTCVQFRRLNTRKGLAVQASRAQVDVDAYPEVMQGLLRATPNLSLVEGEVVAVHTVGGAVRGITLADGTVVDCGALVLTTGTFLRGVLHFGLSSTPGGRVDEPGPAPLSDALRSLGLRLFRLKTGTPARLDGRTIDWGAVPRQEDTVPDGRFSFESDVPPRPEPLPVHLTYTNAAAHDHIRAGLDRSPLFTGVIEGTGPRYCPSIEDKVVRFPDRERHLVFLEPMGHRTPAVYPNGLSTSLPVDVQLAMLRSLDGLGRVEVLRPGYAVEYDAADPTDLNPDLSHRELGGLWLAGQINGTSGYEEAAAQGLIAGISAARGEPLAIGRHEGYLGVMVDDLVTQGIGGEPYRMFTSRAEHRLLLREDNADRRLMPRGRALGLIDDATWAAHERRAEAIARGLAWVNGTTWVPDPATNARLVAAGTAALKRPSTLAEILRRPEVDYGALCALADVPPPEPDVAEQIEIDVKYEGFVARAADRAAEDARMASVPFPDGMDFGAVAGLSTEVRQRLQRAQPRTLGAARRLPGVTPAAVGLLAAWLTIHAP